MKYLIVVVCFLITSISFGQNDCSPYVPVSVGSKWEITNYSSKGKPEGKASYELLEKEEKDNGILFTVKTIAYDKKGKQTFKDKFTAMCEDGQYKIDMAFRMNGMGMENYEEMDVDVESTDMEIPGMNASEGSQLKDATLNIKVSSNSMAVFSMLVEITERKVEKRKRKILLPVHSTVLFCIRK